MVNKHFERCSTSLVIRATQIKATDHFTPTRMDKIKKTTASIGEDVEELEQTLLVEMCSHFGKQPGRFSNG